MKYGGRNEMYGDFQKHILCNARDIQIIIFKWCLHNWRNMILNLNQNSMSFLQHVVLGR